MWQVIIPAAIKSATTIAGGIATARQNRRIAKAQEKQAKEKHDRNISFLQGQINQNPFAQYKTVINKYDKDAIDTMRMAQKQASILGQTPNMTIATQKQLAQSQANLLGQIGDLHASNKIIAEQNILGQQNDLTDAQANIAIQRQQHKNQMWNSILGKAGETASSITAALGDYINKKQ